MTSPLAHLRRTPLRRLLESKGARWRALRDAAIADEVDEAADARRLAIADLSPLPRVGFKGRGTLDAMRRRGVVLEDVPNRAFRQTDGGLCLVLAPGEVILLSNLAGDGVAAGDGLAGWKPEGKEDTYPLPRRDSHAWLAVTGSAAPAMFAKLCAVDLGVEKFPDLAIAQTPVAGVSAIIARADLGRTPVYQLLADGAAALYLCSCLRDAAAEFGGRLAGVRAAEGLEE